MASGYSANGNPLLVPELRVRPPGRRRPGPALRAREPRSRDHAITRLIHGDCGVDTPFGTNGKVVGALELGGPNAEFASAVVGDATRVTVAGTVSRTLNAGADRDFAAVRLINDLSPFADGFE